MRMVKLGWCGVSRHPAHSWSILRLLCTPPSRTPSYYDDLGVHPQSTSREIKAAFYALSKEYHPDKNVGNTEAQLKFQTISEAYDVLGNADRRTKYDKGVLGRASSVAERERATHRFEGEAFYESRKGGTASKDRRKELDAWVSDNREAQFHHKLHLKKKKGTIADQRRKAIAGSSGGYSSNSGTDQSLGIITKFTIVVVVILFLIVRSFS